MIVESATLLNAQGYAREHRGKAKSIEQVTSHDSEHLLGLRSAAVLEAQIWAQLSHQYLVTLIPEISTRHSEIHHVV